MNNPLAPFIKGERCKSKGDFRILSPLDKGDLGDYSL